MWFPSAVINWLWMYCCVAITGALNKLSAGSVNCGDKSFLTIILNKPYIIVVKLLKYELKRNPRLWIELYFTCRHAWGHAPTVGIVRLIFHELCFRLWLSKPIICVYWIVRKDQLRIFLGFNSSVTVKISCFFAVHKHKTLNKSSIFLWDTK